MKKTLWQTEEWTVATTIHIHQILFHFPLPGHIGKMHFPDSHECSESWNVNRSDKCCFCAQEVKCLWTSHMLSLLSFTADIRSHILKWHSWKMEVAYDLNRCLGACCVGILPCLYQTVKGVRNKHLEWSQLHYGNVRINELDQTLVISVGLGKPGEMEQKGQWDL